MRRPVTLTARPNRPVRDERGTILVITVVAMLLLAVLALSFSMVATLEGRMGVNYHGQVKALHVADAGIEGVKRELLDSAMSYYPGNTWTGTWKPLLQALGTLCDGTKQVAFTFAPTDALGWVRSGASPPPTLFIRDNVASPGENADECEDRDGILTIHATGRLAVAGGLAAVNKPVSLDVTWNTQGGGWDNAVNGGTGTGAVINGNAMVYGGVRLVNTGGGVVWAMGGTAGVRNNYQNGAGAPASEQISAATRGLLNPALLVLGDVALNAGFSVQQGTVTFAGGATIGLPQGTVTDRKQTLDMAIANDFDPGGLSEIHADVERSGTVTGTFPFLADPVCPAPCTPTDNRTWEAKMNQDGIHITAADLTGGYVIDATVGVPTGTPNQRRLCRPNPWPSCAPQTINGVTSVFDLTIDTAANVGTLVAKGIIVFDNFPSGVGLQIGKRVTSNQLDAIIYSGDAVIFVDDGDPANCLTPGTACAGHVTVAAEWKTAAGAYPTAVNPPAYPPAANTINNIAIVAERMGLARGADDTNVNGAANLPMTGLFYAQTQVYSCKQNEIFGSLFSRTVTLSCNVPKIAAVKTMTWFLPPGLIGSTPPGPGTLAVLRWREGTQ